MNPRTRVVTIALAGASLLGLYLIVLDPILGRIDRANQAIGAVQANLRKQGADPAREIQLRRTLSGVRAELSRRDDAQLNKSLVDLAEKIGHADLKYAIHMSTKSKKTDEFSEDIFTMDGEGTIEGVTKLLFELTYFKDYFRLRRPTLTAREGGRVGFALTGSALMANAPVTPTKSDPKGLPLPAAPSFETYKPVLRTNIFSPPAELLPSKAGTPTGRKVQVRVSAVFQGGEGELQACLETPSGPVFLKKGAKYGRYEVVEIKKEPPNNTADPAEAIKLLREGAKEPVVIRYGEATDLLTED